MVIRVNRNLPYPSDSLENRFWKYVRVKEVDECWQWVGSYNINQNGDRLPRFCYHSREAPSVCILFYFKYRKWPDEEQIYHLCGNTMCVNLDHLTYIENPQHRCLRCGKGVSPGVIYCRSHRLSSVSAEANKNIPELVRRQTLEGELKCGICGAEISDDVNDGRKVVVDHIKPRKIDGSADNNIGNLQLAHNLCNLNKRTSPYIGPPLPPLKC